MTHNRLFAVLGSILCAAFAASLEAKTLRWSSQGDISTMDPHAQNEGLNNAASAHIYESLYAYDKKMDVEPCLATSWERIGETTFRFKLRPNVRFHDGTPFSADDVVFSLERAMAPTSNFKVLTEGIAKVVKVDDLTVDILTDGPAPVLIKQLPGLRIMSKAWSESHDVRVPQDFRNKQETFASRNANGTGPYVLKSREADVKTVFVANPKWWGKREGNVDEIVYLPIKSDGTRMAALLSGEIDFVLDPPIQDLPRLEKNPGMKVVNGTENRTIFLGMDVWRDELLYGSVKGRNPFKDVRVRRAMYHAIDIEAIKNQVMRGLARPAGTMIAPSVFGYTKEADRRLAFDLVRARKLLAEAGYPTGFEVTLDCPNNRYVNDEKICVALAAMLAKVDIKVKVNAMSRALFFPKVQKYDTSFYLIGWGVATLDSLNALQTVIHSPGKGADGEQNYGKYSNATVDAAIDKLKVENDPKRRIELTTEALMLHREEAGHIPLHYPIIPWAMRSGVTVNHLSNNWFMVKWVTVK